MDVSDYRADILYRCRIYILRGKAVIDIEYSTAEIFRYIAAGFLVEFSL